MKQKEINEKGWNTLVEFERLKNSQTYTLSGSLDTVLKTIRENLESFPRRVPGKLNLDGRDFYYADLHSFYYQSMQILADKNYDFESETENPIILDCGSHIGLASIFFAGRYPNATIYAFEADPLIAQMCQENIRSFGLSDRVKVFNKAVWTHNNGIQFNTSCDDSGYIAGNQTSGEITTPSVRLRDLIQDQPIEYIKLDIEGSEFEVIKDCKDALGNVNKIIVEVHQLGKMAGASSQLLKVLEDSNFSYVFDDLHSAPWVEEFNKPPFARLKTDKYYLTVYAWRQNKASSSQQVQRFNDVQPISMSPEGEIYITDNAVVQRFDDKGKKVEDIILEAQPSSMAVANNTRMYVGMKDHVQVYEGGRPIARWPSLGQKAVLTNIVIDGPDIFVADAGNGVIIRYDQYGHIVNHTVAKHTDWNAPESMTSPPYFSLTVNSDKSARMVKYQVPGRYKRIYHYHIRKTGGTSLNHMMFSLGGDPGRKCYMALNRSDSGQGMSNGIAFANWKAPPIEQGNYYYAHSHTPMHKIDLPPDTFTVTMLRDPIKRFISYYRSLMHLKTNNIPHEGMKIQGPWLANSFGDFLQNIPKDYLLQQLYMFSKDYNVEEAFDNIVNRCSHFFFTENFTEGIVELSSRIGTKLTPIHTRKSTFDFEIKESDREYLRNLLQKEYDLIEKLKRYKQAQLLVPAIDTCVC